MSKQSEIRAFFSSRKRLNSDSSDEESDTSSSSKRHRSNSPCPVCNRRAERNVNYIQCSSCEKWVHVKICSELQAADLANNDIVQKFKCKVCLEDLDTDVTVMEFNDATPDREVLKKILSELSSLRAEARIWRRMGAQVAKMSAENSSLRRQIREIIEKSDSNMRVHRSDARGRSDHRQNVNKQAESRSRSRSKTPVNVRFANVKQKTRQSVPTKSTTAARTVNTLPSEHSATARRQARTLEVSKKPGSVSKCSLPKSKLRLANARAMVVLRDTDVSCQELHNYLKSHSINANSVCKLKQKSRNYSTYVVECNEVFIEPLFNEEMWHGGTFVKEFLGTPHPNGIHSMFPERG